MPTARGINKPVTAPGPSLCTYFCITSSHCPSCSAVLPAASLKPRIRGPPYLLFPLLKTPSFAFSRPIPLPRECLVLPTSIRVSPAEASLLRPARRPRTLPSQQSLQLVMTHLCPFLIRTHLPTRLHAPRRRGSGLFAHLCIPSVQQRQHITRPGQALAEKDGRAARSLRTGHA